MPPYSVVCGSLSAQVDIVPSDPLASQQSVVASLLESGSPASSGEEPVPASSGIPQVAPLAPEM